MRRDGRCLRSESTIPFWRVEFITEKEGAWEFVE